MLCQTQAATNKQIKIRNTLGGVQAPNPELQIGHFREGQIEIK